MCGHIQKDIQLAMDIAVTVTKCRYNSYHRQKEFVEGDEVWIFQGDVYRLQGNVNPKLWPCRQGPYHIMCKVTPLTYKLDVGNNKIYPVISI